MSHINNTDKNELIKMLENGYKEMADINLEIAQDCLVSDNESLARCEEILTECD